MFIMMLYTFIDLYLFVMSFFDILSPYSRCSIIFSLNIYIHRVDRCTSVKTLIIWGIVEGYVRKLVLLKKSI